MMLDVSLRDRVRILGDAFPASELAGYFQWPPFDSSLRSSAQGRLYGTFVSLRPLYIKSSVTSP